MGTSPSKPCVHRKKDEVKPEPKKDKSVRRTSIKSTFKFQDLCPECFNKRVAPLVLDQLPAKDVFHYRLVCRGFNRLILRSLTTLNIAKLNVKTNYKPQADELVKLLETKFPDMTKIASPQNYKPTDEETNFVIYLLSKSSKLTSAVLPRLKMESTLRDNKIVLAALTELSVFSLDLSSCSCLPKLKRLTVEHILAKHGVSDGSIAVLERLEYICFGTPTTKWLFDCPKEARKVLVELLDKAKLLPGMKRFVLSGSAVCEAILRCVCQKCPNLEQLALTFGQIVSLEPLPKLKSSLRTLAICRLGVEKLETSAGYLGQMANLTTLTTGSWFKSLDSFANEWSFLGNYAKLLYLNLQSSSIFSEDLAYIPLNAPLQSLDIGFTAAVCPEVLQLLIKRQYPLRYFNASGGQPDAFPSKPEWFQFLQAHTKLETLVLNKCPIDGSFLSECINLKPANTSNDTTSSDVTNPNLSSLILRDNGMEPEHVTNFLTRRTCLKKSDVAQLDLHIGFSCWSDEEEALAKKANVRLWEY